MTVRLEGGEQIHTPLLIGADGVRSRVARAVGLGDTNFAGYIAYRSGILCDYLQCKRHLAS